MDWKKLGTALSGMGAGFSGQGPSWQTAQAVSRRQAEEARVQQELERKERMLRDMYQVQQSLANQDINGARYHLINRLDRLRESGEDSSNTFNMLRRLEGGDVSGVLNDVSASIKFFTDMGAGQTASIRNFNFARDVLNNPNSTDAERQGAMYMLGGAGRPQGTRMVERGGNIFIEDAASGEVLQAYGPNGQPLTSSWMAGEKGTVSEGEEAGKDRQAGRAERIKVGLDAAMGIPTARRALELLKKVETGGPEAISLRAKQALGAENADEGELANILGKAVLSQLRATFGAQFTEREGALLQRIEAGFGKSNAANVRVLNNLIKLAEMRANTALNAAKEMDDFGSALEIKNYLDFSYSDEDDDYSWLGASPAANDGLPEGFVIDQ